MRLETSQRLLRISLSEAENISLSREVHHRYHMRSRIKNLILTRSLRLSLTSDCSVLTCLQMRPSDLHKPAAFWVNSRPVLSLATTQTQSSSIRASSVPRCFFGVLPKTITYAPGNTVQYHFTMYSIVHTMFSLPSPKSGRPSYSSKN